MLAGRVAEAEFAADLARLWPYAAYDARKLREGLRVRGITPVIAHDPRQRGRRRWQPEGELHPRHRTAENQAGVRHTEAVLRPYPQQVATP